MQKLQNKNISINEQSKESVENLLWMKKDLFIDKIQKLAKTFLDKELNKNKIKKSLNNNLSENRQFR